MNVQKIFNLSGGMNLYNQKKEKFSPSKNYFESGTNTNTHKINKNILYKTITLKNKSSNKNICNKSNNRKQSSDSIKNSNKKSSKIFKIQKNKNNRVKLSLNLSDNENKNKNIVYNTINAINPKIKIFNKNNFVIKDINKKNKTIQNSTRMKYSHIRCNTYSPKYNGNKDDFISKTNNKKESNNNIIINFFNAPINKYNEEFYFNNINDMNKIIKNKKIKKKVFNIFNQANKKSNHKNNLYTNNINKNKNFYPLFSNINQGNNYAINNKDLDFQIYQNKKKAISNVIENLKDIFDTNTINKIKKSPKYQESLENYSNKYKKIKFIKNKKSKNLSLNIKLKGKNKLKTIFKRTKNYNNINTINNNIIINIKKEHFIKNKSIKTDHNKSKNKHILYNLLFKTSLKTEHNYSNKSKQNKKSKNAKNILLFNTLHSFKSIEVERNSRKFTKFNTLITEVLPNKKSNKNKFLKKSKAQIYINENIQNYQKSNDIQDINNNNNCIITSKNNILKYDKKYERIENALKPILHEPNNELIYRLPRDKDPKYSGEYHDEILCNLFLEEKAYMEKIGVQISSDILNNYGINPETRTCLIDSLIDLQKIFNFNERTLFIAVQLFDRYLVLSLINETDTKLKEENLDIILTTALLIASKLEESVLYKLSDYLGILSDKYSIEDIKILENKMMNAFNFAAVSPTVLDFFEIFAEKAKLNNEQKNLGLFLLNTILLDINLSQISGSVIAYAVIIIIKGFKKKNDCKNLIEVLNKVNNKNANQENMDALSLMNNEEKMDELCNLIQVFAEGILNTEYNHISIKFNYENHNYLSKINKINARSSI